MPTNNATEVVKGVVQPRFYQVYGDLIESKEVMEPLAIVGGTGPVCGFDWVDTSKSDVTITSIFNTTSLENVLGREILRGKSRRVFLSNKGNTAGQVFNAYITPDGLCHIAPDTLTFNGVQPDGGWPSLTNPQKVVAFVVKASHSYKADSSDPAPSISNFTCNWLVLPGELKFENILRWDYNEVMNILVQSSVPWNQNTDTIIGLYFVGWDPYWDTDPESSRYKSIMAQFNFTLCLVPIQGKFPVEPWGMSPLEALDLDRRVSALEETSIPGQVDNLTAKVDNLVSSLGSGVDVSLTKGESGDDDQFIFTRLNIKGSTFVSGRNVTKTINSSWYENADALGIFIAPNISLVNPTTVVSGNWDIGSVVFEPGLDGSLVVGDAIPPSGKSDWQLVAIINPQLIGGDSSLAISNGFISQNGPDPSLSWVIGMYLKRLYLNKQKLEIVDSGQISIMGNIQSYAYFKAIMGVNTITLRVFVHAYNGGSIGECSVDYNLANLFGKNSKMSGIIDDLINLRDTSIDTTKIYLAMPTNFEATDIDATLSSKKNFQIQNYNAHLDITTNSVHMVVKYRANSVASSPGDWINICHSITLPITDRTLDLYSDIIRNTSD